MLISLPIYCSINQAHTDGVLLSQSLIFKKDNYLFTTENIAGYINEMDVKDKSVLTLGSSLDQAYNALLLEAEELTVFDINVNIEMFHMIKKELILNYSRNDLYNNVIVSMGVKDLDQLPSIQNKYNLYMHNDDNYELLREKLLEKDISFINGDIFDIKDELKNKKYDRMILSNVIQYLELYSHNKNKFDILKKMFNKD